MLVVKYDKEQIIDQMFHLQLAGQAFTIDNHYGYVEELCRDYRTDQPGERIVVDGAAIAREQTDGRHWFAGYLESLAIYRAICERLLVRNIVSFYCSALAYKQRAYLFAAPSGTGKSTHVRLWRGIFGSAVTIINDDKPLLHVSSEAVTVYGTPFAGKEGLQTNTDAQVEGIVLLHQAEVNTIRSLTMEEAYPLLLAQTYRPNAPEKPVKTLELVHRLAQLPVYALGCTISQEAVELAWKALTQGKIGILYESKERINLP